MFASEYGKDVLNLFHLLLVHISFGGNSFYDFYDAWISVRVAAMIL